MSSFEVGDADATRALGQALAAHLRAGDLVMLRGELGAGKTTFAQGVGAGLHVRGHVSSPTFIVARVHPSLVGGPDLIHADAYRIKDLDDLETLDLDSSLADSVTLVEWGEGKTEGLSDQRLEVDVTRPRGGTARDEDGVIDLEQMDDGHRTITLRPFGTRWVGELDHLGEEAAALAAAAVAPDAAVAGDAAVAVAPDTATEGEGEDGSSAGAAGPGSAGAASGSASGADE